MLCHCCEEEETEYTCPDCGEPTCEDCFIHLTQFNAGYALPCIICDGSNERLLRDESDRQYDLEKAKSENRRKRNEAAKARYHSTEACAKRNAMKAERHKAEIEYTRKRLEKLGEVMSEFMKLF